MPIRMFKHLLLLLLLGGCVSDADRPDFAAMSAEDLAAYNASVSIENQVLCRTDREIGSLIMRRTCQSRMEDYLEKRRHMNLLRTVNSGPVGVDLR